VSHSEKASAARRTIETQPEASGGRRSAPISSKEPASWRSLAASALLSIAAAAALCSCGEEPRVPRHLFFVTVDTLRADHLGAYGYERQTSPRIDRLAAEGVLFERAIAQWPKTGPSFASLLVGQYPQTTGLTHKAAIRLSDGYLTLPELLQRQGFVTLAVISNAVLAHRLGWSQGFDEYLQTWKLAPEVPDDAAEHRKWINARRVNQLAEPLLERYQGSERLFVWLHYSDPHAPYLLQEGVTNPFIGDAHYRGEELAVLDERRRVALGDHRELRYYVAQYDANVLFVDTQIEKILARALDLGLLADAAVVFTSDHGESLGEHGYYFGHGRLPYNASAHVPLIFWDPHSLPEGAAITEPVELVDLFPTLVDLLGLDSQVPGLEGESLLPLLIPESPSPDGGEGTRLAFSQAGGGSPTTHFRSVQDEGWKLVYHPRLGGRRQRPASFELYRLSDDPAESTDLAEQHPEQMQRLRRRLFEWMKGTDWIRLPREEVEEHSQETLNALKALGYVD
jgi:arylsulfatase A-like enzyme